MSSRSSAEHEQTPGGSDYGDTPATTPSSSGSALAHKQTGAGASLPARSKEADCFLSNLDNYVALGCLHYEDLTDGEDERTSESWETIHVLPACHCFDLTLYSHLSRLLDASWVRIQAGRSSVDQRFIILRVFILPGDAGHRFIDRSNKKLWLALECLISEVDISTDVWQGRLSFGRSCNFDAWATSCEGSLFYAFNTLPSPAPKIDTVKESYAREALEDLLDPASVLPGLKTVLYPYQRRSAGLMLQRESVAKLELDPRLEKRIAPDGSTFYYSARDLLFLRSPKFYESCKGGILAETMGLGKTVILLSLVLATKHHLPKVPASYSLPRTRSSVASLSSMAVSAINRKSIPWKVEFERIRNATGNNIIGCQELLENTPPSYEIPMEPQRWNRKTVQPPPKKVTLASTTLIVVPRNLCKQWQSELSKHVEDKALSVLVMEDLKRALPHADELRQYDVVLFSRPRFEMEVRDGSDEQGRRLSATQLVCRCPYIGATRTRDCHCIRSEELYDSPLKHLHFKRLVIDEGHFFSNTNTVAVTVANKLVTADHRWVVSGTPAKDLLGVEVDLASAESALQSPVGETAESSRDATLSQRRSFDPREDSNGAIKSLGSLASRFLKIRPWCPLDSSERRAEWDEYIYRHESLRKRTFSGFSSSFQRVLESMVVKTQPEDVERDIELPPLSHEIVRLEPSFYDKLTANLFTLVLTANAITSERTDADYLFHKNSAKARYHLIANLRQSAFFWSGFSEADVKASMDNSSRYLAKEDTGCTEADRILLTEILVAVGTVVDSTGWRSMSRSHELGVFLRSWPLDSAQHWAFGDELDPILTGISQLLEVQKYVNQRAGSFDPGEGLSGAGIRSLASARQGSAEKAMDHANGGDQKPVLTKSGIPLSSLDGEPTMRRRSTGSKGARQSPVKLTRSFKVTKPQAKRIKTSPSPNKPMTPDEWASGIAGESTDATLPSRKRQKLCVEAPDFDDGSPYLRGQVVGTASAKLSYLISQILKYYREEKILVFYDGDNVAYYIAQMLELLHIKHEIYAKSLAAHLKSEYVVRFDQETQDRVLLMDVKQAAFGLNLSSASRIYFVNPVCRPNVEAQAIKRAHRIGQTRKVFVETLVLKGTIEEEMLERSQRMTRLEHRDAKLLEDDGGIRDIIQNARLLPLTASEASEEGQMALLEEPQQLWGRVGWRESLGVAAVSRQADENNFFETPNKANKVGGKDRPARNDQRKDPLSTPGAKRKRLAFVDATDQHADPMEVSEESEDDAPIMDTWRRSSFSHVPVESRARARFASAMSVMFGSSLRSSNDPPLPAMNAGERLTSATVADAKSVPGNEHQSAGYGIDPSEVDIGDS